MTGAVVCVTVLVSLIMQLMKLNRQHPSLSLLPTVTAANRSFYTELLSFLMVVTCISGVTILSCHLLTGEVTLLPDDLFVC